MNDRLAYQRFLAEIVKDSIPESYQIVSKLNDDLRLPKPGEDVTVLPTLREVDILGLPSTNLRRFLSFTIFENHITLDGEDFYSKPVDTPFSIFETREFCHRVEDKAWVLLNLHFPGLFEKPVVFDFKTWEEIEVC